MDSLDQKLNCLAYLFQYLNKELLLLMSNLIYSILELLFSHDNPPFYNFLFLILIIYYLSYCYHLLLIECEKRNSSCNVLWDGKLAQRKEHVDKHALLQTNRFYFEIAFLFNISTRYLSLVCSNTS